MKVYTYTEARQTLAAVLDQARREGAVRIRCPDGSPFVIRVEEREGSPLDVGGVETDVTTAEIERRLGLGSEATSPSDFDRLLEETSGIWSEGDGLEYQRRLREEWTRRWDPEAQEDA